MLILEVINENSLTQDVKAIIKSVYKLRWNKGSFSIVNVCRIFFLKIFFFYYDIEWWSSMFDSVPFFEFAPVLTWAIAKKKKKQGESFEISTFEIFLRKAFVKSICFRYKKNKY